MKGASIFEPSLRTLHVTLVFHTCMLYTSAYANQHSKHFSAPIIRLRETKIPTFIHEVPTSEIACSVNLAECAEVLALGGILPGVRTLLSRVCIRPLIFFLAYY